MDVMLHYFMVLDLGWMDCMDCYIFICMFVRSVSLCTTQSP